MPLFDLQPSLEVRRRVFIRAQLPLLVATSFVVIMASISQPAVLAMWPFVAGFSVIGLASLAAYFVPWERLDGRALVSVAAADLVGVGCLRADVITFLPSVGFLIVFPVLWLSYGFRRRFLIVTISGTLFTTFLPAILTHNFPGTALEWANIVVLPVLVTTVAIAVNTAAQQLLKSRDEAAVAANERKVALQRSQNAETLSRAILETVDAAVAFYDTDGRLVVSNTQARDLVDGLGFSLETPPHAGQNVFQADRVTRIPLDDQIIPRALRGDMVDHHTEWLGQPGDQIAIQATSRPVLHDDGTPLGTVIVAYDVSELANAINTREQFLTTVSHELRTPLTSILGYLEIIEEELQGTELGIESFIATVRRNGTLLQSRIAQLLSVAGETEPLHFTSTDVSDLVRNSVDNVRPAAATREHTLTSDVPANVYATIDGPRIGEVLENLLTNAIKYTPDGGIIHVRLQEFSDSVSIMVADNGTGMSREDQRQIFDRFFRSQKVRTGAIQGIGVGMSIVKEIVDGHSGSIELTSELQIGTKFVITLPRVHDRAEASGVDTERSRL